MEDSYRYFSNKSCQYFPCHKGADADNFNCMFCYCPLYVLGENCGGKFVYLSNGCKDCSACLIPHRPDGYDKIISKYEEIIHAIDCLEEREK